MSLFAVNEIWRLRLNWLFLILSSLLVAINICSVTSFHQFVTNATSDKINITVSKVCVCGVASFPHPTQIIITSNTEEKVGWGPCSNEAIMCGSIIYPVYSEWSLSFWLSLPGTFHICIHYSAVVCRVRCDADLSSLISGSTVCTKNAVQTWIAM